jgi:hypothetical protein
MPKQVTVLASWKRMFRKHKMTEIRTAITKSEWKQERRRENEVFFFDCRSSSEFDTDICKARNKIESKRTVVYTLVLRCNHRLLLESSFTHRPGQIRNPSAACLQGRMTSGCGPLVVSRVSASIIILSSDMLPDIRS